VNYGFEEKPSRIALVFGVVFGAATGLVAGFFGFFAATALAGLIGDALPSLSGLPALAVYIGFLTLPAGAFASVARARHATLGARVMCGVAFAVVAALAVGEVTGTIRLYPHDFHFFIAPIAP
jgi:hypothetical protein